MASPKTSDKSSSLPAVPREHEGKLVVPPGSRFALVVSRFNHFIVDRLVDGALDALRRHGADLALAAIVRVPGAWEMPVAAARIVRGKGGVAGGAARFDAVIALGCVIRGSTPHFDYVAAEVTKGLANVSIDTGIPIALGVLTTDTIEQAIERAGTKGGNKGFEAACSAIEMVSLFAGF